MHTVWRKRFVPVMAGMLLMGCGGDSSNGGPSLSERYETALRTTDPVERARSLADIAVEQREAGSYSDSKKSIAAAIEACRDAEGPSAQASAYACVAMAQAKIGKRSDARSLIRDARVHIAQIEQSKDRVGPLPDIARTCLQLEDSRAATAALRQARDAANEIQDQLSRSTCLIGIAPVHFEMKEDDEEGLALVEEAMGSAESIGDPRRRADALISMAAALRKLNRSEDSAEALEASLEAARQIESSISKAHALAAVANELIAAGKKGEARSIVDEARVAAEASSDPGVRREVLEKINNLLSRTN